MIQKEFIRNELRYRYPDLADHIAAPQGNVGRPLLFEGGERKFGARIIIATGKEMDSLPIAGQEEALFLAIDTPKGEIIAAYDVCVLPPDAQVGAVFNFAQRLFDRLDDWTQSLRQAAETGEGVAELLSRASGMLQNPVFLLDERGHAVASSEQTDAWRLKDLALFAKLPDDTGTSGRVRKISRDGAPDALAFDFRAGERLFSLLCLASERALYASDEIVFDSLAGFLRLMLSERTLRFGTLRHSRENEAAASVFRAMLAQELPEREANESLRKLGWNDQQGYAVLAIEPASGNLRAAQADAVCDQIETEIEGCCAFTLLPAVIALARTDFLKEPAFIARVQSVAGENALLIGVCEAYPGFSYLLQRKEQAIRALNRAADFGGAAAYADLFEDELTANALTAFPAELVCMRSVRAMAQYDRAHETSYLETAERYVKNRFNAVKTAGELFIHRSTFLYRLERIRDQFGLNLDDGGLSLLHLLYSLRVVRAQ